MYKETSRDSERYCIESIDEFEKYHHSNNEVFCCMNIEWFFHLCIFGLSFYKILSFLEYKLCASFVIFIPQYFIPFDAIVNGIFSFISFSACSLQIHRNTTDFCIVILHPANVLSFFFVLQCSLRLSLQADVHLFLLKKCNHNKEGTWLPQGIILY